MMDERVLVEAHRACAGNKDDLAKSDKCGCFYCLSVYDPSEVVKWVDSGRTAICPKCAIDSVLASASGWPVDDADFLGRMYKRWFEKTVGPLLDS